MAGGGLYGEHSAPQASASGPAMRLLREAAANVPLSDNTPTVLADFGCADGSNSMMPMATAIEALRARSRPAVEIAVVHTDIVSNDFNALFRRIETPVDSYLGEPGVYGFASARTLYGPALPTASLTLGWSSITLQWLSSPPVPLKSNVWCLLADADEQEAWRKQSKIDWHDFLVERSRELVSGGELVLVGIVLDDNGTLGTVPLQQTQNEALLAGVSWLSVFGL